MAERLGVPRCSLQCLPSTSQGSPKRQHSVAWETMIYVGRPHAMPSCDIWKGCSTSHTKPLLLLCPPRPGHLMGCEFTKTINYLAAKEGLAICEFCNGLKSIEYMDLIYTRDKIDSSKDQMFSFSSMEISSQACPHGNVLCHPINQVRKDFKLVATCLF